MNPEQTVRMIDLIGRATELLRAGGGRVGNPNHDNSGRFASSSGGGAAGPGGRDRRRRLRQLRDRHQAERAEQHQSQASESGRLERVQRREAAAHDRRHAARLAAHARTAPERHARVDREQARKARRIEAGERKARGTEARHQAEREDFERHTGDDRSHVTAANERMYEHSRAQLKAKGGTPGEHAALEARIAEHRAKFADPHAGLRQAMDERHAAEKAKADAFLRKSDDLKGRLSRQTAAKHAWIDRISDRLRRREAADRAEMVGRHASDRRDLAEEHAYQRDRLDRRQLHQWKQAGGRTRPRGTGGGRESAGAARRSPESRGAVPRTRHDSPRTLGEWTDGDPDTAVSDPAGMGGQRGHPDARRPARSAASVVAGAAGPVEAPVHRTGPVDAELTGRRLQGGRTHKASSAEAILRHCLRSTGCTAAWKADEMTGDEAMVLLEATRAYGRAWLRHEASQVFQAYGKLTNDARVLAGVRPDGHPQPTGDLARSRDLAGDPTASIAGLAGHAGPAADAGGVAAVSQVRGLDPAMDGLGGAGRMSEMREIPGIDDDLLARSLAADARHAVSRFFQRARQFSRELILAGAMAIHGPRPLDARDLDEADHQWRVQTGYLEDFERAVMVRTPPELAAETPEAFEPTAPITMGMFIARAESYGAAVWGAAQEIERRGIVRRSGGAVLERREHVGPDRPCPGCVNEANKAWQPPGTLLPIGFCECLENCHCHFEYKYPDGSVRAIGSRVVKSG